MKTIVEYDPTWPVKFDRLRAVFVKNLTKLVAVEHVGSTAVIGLCAKPVIDIDLVIASTADFAVTKQELEQLGYAHQGDWGIKGREVFQWQTRTLSVKSDKALAEIEHHLYVCEAASRELSRHILLRDYLRTHADKRDAYAQIKREIVEKYGNEDRQAYVMAKERDYSNFFEEMLKEASLKG